MASWWPNLETRDYRGQRLRRRTHKLPNLEGREANLQHRLSEGRPVSLLSSKLTGWQQINADVAQDRVADGLNLALGFILMACSGTKVAQVKLTLTPKWTHDDVRVELRDHFFAILFDRHLGIERNVAEQMRE